MRFGQLVSLAAVFCTVGVAAHPPRSFHLIADTLEEARVGHRLLAITPDTIAIIGGAYGDWGGMGTLEVFDINNFTFRTLPARLKEPRSNATVTPLGDGRFLAAGGATDFTPALATTEIIDFNLGTVTEGPELAEARANHVAFSLADGRVVVAGGSNFTGSLSSAEIYDPTSNRFEPISLQMSATRESPAVTALDQNRFLISGGFGRDLNNPDPSLAILKSAEVFDDRTLSFTQLAAGLKDHRLYHTATLLRDGRVLLAGGIRKLREPSASAELFDPHTMTFSAAEKMTTPRAAHTAVQIDNENILVCGGVSFGTGTADCEELEVQSGQFLPAPPMRLARWSHQAIAVPGNRMLVVGGMHIQDNPEEEPSGPNRTAEIYQ